MRVVFFLMLAGVAGYTQTDYRFEAREIAGGESGVEAIAILDINNDSRPDIAVTGAGGLVWFANPDWKRHEAVKGDGLSIGVNDPSPGLGRVCRIRRLAAIDEAEGSLGVFTQPTETPDPQKSTVRDPVVKPDSAWRREASLADGGIRATAWADFDGDGSDELAAGGTRLLLFDRGASGQWTDTRVGAGPLTAVAAADLNGDGLADAVAASAKGDVTVFENRSQPGWRRHVIAEGYMNQTAIGADFTGDGKIDVISTDARGKRTYLYAAPDWKAVVLQTRTQAIHSAVIDVDGDGDPDYIGARYTTGLIFWLENPANPLRDPWPFHVIDADADGGVNGIHGLITGDVDGDGKLDLIANSAQPTGAFPNSLAWFRIPADPTARWERHIFANGNAPGLSHYHGFGDVNGDGRGDIASAAKIGAEGNWFAWWEQPAAPGGEWKKHLISDNEPGATNILIADVNGDGRNDFIGSRGHGIGLVWFENPSLKPHQINTSLIGPHSLAVGDIDGDGDLDAATCAKDSHIAAWFENDGAGNFTTHHIHENQASYDVRLVDMDGDGDLDLLNAGQESRNVVWFENRLR